MPAVIFTKPQQEARAIRSLKRGGFEVFLPLCVTRRNADPSPLFPRYVFAWFNGIPWWFALSCQGVVSVLKAGDKPGEIADDVVDSIRQRMDDDGGAVNLVVEPQRRVFRPGDKIMVIGGEHVGMEGMFVGNSGTRVVVMLSMFNRQLKASIPERNIA